MPSRGAILQGTHATRSVGSFEETLDNGRLEDVPELPAMPLALPFPSVLGLPWAQPSHSHRGAHAGLPCAGGGCSARRCWWPHAAGSPLLPKRLV